MQGPEDDAGLAGKVALISGGGAAGDGIGNGRAAGSVRRVLVYVYRQFPVCVVVFDAGSRGSERCLDGATVREFENFALPREEYNQSRRRWHKGLSYGHSLSQNNGAGMKCALSFRFQ